MKKSTVHFLAASAPLIMLAVAIVVAFTFSENAVSQDGTPNAAQPAPNGETGSNPKAEFDDPKRSLPLRVGSLLTGFFEKMQEAKIDAAYTALLDGSKISSRKEDVASLHEHARRAIAEYGAIRAFDVLESRFAGENLLRVTVLSVGADYPLRWRFYFYKGGQDWRLLDLRVDDGLSGMFDPNAEDADGTTGIQEAPVSTEAGGETP